MRGIIYLLAFCIAVLSVIAADLGDYPSFFVDGDVVNAVLVVGDAAKASDTLGSADIIASLQYRFPGKVLVGAAKFSSEIDDITKINAVVVGGPCANAAASQLMGYPENCLQGFLKGKGIIRLYENEGKYQLLVAGATGLDTRRASRVVSNYDDYNFTESEMIVFGTTISDVVIS